MEQTSTERAEEFARRVHAGQVDKAGEDYVSAHVADVVSRLEPDDEVGRTVAWLHDTVEDGPAGTRDELVGAFPDQVVEAVDALTHGPDEDRAAYYRRVAANPLALRVKHADLGSNTDPDRLARLDPATRERLEQKYRTAREALGL